METSNIDYSIGPGWERIVAPILAYARSIDAKVLQVKEKFGMVRIYYAINGNMHSHPALNSLISAVELQSGKVCEWCGAPGRRRKGHWIKTLCDEHEILWNEGKRWWIGEDGRHV